MVALKKAGKAFDYLRGGLVEIEESQPLLAFCLQAVTLFSMVCARLQTKKQPRSR